MKNLSKKSIHLIDSFEKSFESTEEKMFFLTLDYIETRKRLKLSHFDAYKLYRAAGLVSLSSRTFQNRGNWCYGTFDDFKRLGTKEYTVFCAAKRDSIDVDVDSYYDKRSSENVFDDSYTKFQSTDYYALMLNMTIEELRDVQEFIPIMIRGGTDEYNQIKSISLETTWQDYEKIIMNEFIAAGASAHLTKEGSDGGIDIIAELNEIKIGVQVKFLSTKVSSSVVGEVLMGIGMHDCDYGCVVAISGYTKPCKNQSLKNDVKLLHFSDIKKYINRIRQKNIRKL